MKRQINSKSFKEKNAEMEKSGNIDTTAYQNLQREIEETSTDLKNLRQDAKNVTDEFGHPISHDQYDALQREIIETEQNLESLQTQARNTSTVLDTIAANGEKLKTVGTNITTAGQKMLPVTAEVTAVGTASVKSSADFEASIGILVNNGIKSSQAGTVLRKSINSLVAPTKKAVTEMQSLGFYSSETIDRLEGLSLVDGEQERHGRLLIYICR